MTWISSCFETSSPHISKTKLLTTLECILLLLPASVPFTGAIFRGISVGDVDCERVRWESAASGITLERVRKGGDNLRMADRLRIERGFYTSGVRATGRRKGFDRTISHICSPIRSTRARDMLSQCYNGGRQSLRRCNRRRVYEAPETTSSHGIREIGGSVDAFFVPTQYFTPENNLWTCRNDIQTSCTEEFRSYFHLTEI